MSDLGVKYTYELSEKLVEDVRYLLKTLQIDKDIKDLYESFINEIYENVYLQKECKKILTTLYFSLQMIKENLEKNNFIRSDVFFMNEPNKTLVEEILDGIIILSKNEHEEPKLKYYGYLIGNIMFNEKLDRYECNRLIKLCGNLSYCQIKLINMYVISQTIQVPILKRDDFTKIGVRDYKLLGILQDTLDMIQKSILNGSGSLVLDLVQINPSKIKVQGTGILLYNNMSLNKMPYDELEDLLDILSNNN